MNVEKGSLVLVPTGQKTQQEILKNRRVKGIEIAMAQTRGPAEKDPQDQAHVTRENAGAALTRSTI